MSADSNAQTSLSEEAVAIVTTTSSLPPAQTFTTDVTDQPMSSLSLDSNQNTPAESISIPETHEIASGFDSADSTNDEDFLKTQKAVLSAIDLVDEGLKNEAESSKGSILEDKSQCDNFIPKNECKPKTDNSSSKKLERILDTDKITNNVSQEGSKIDSFSSQTKSISDYSEKVDFDSVKSSNSGDSLEENSNKEINEEAINLENDITEDIFKNKADAEPKHDTENESAGSGDNIGAGSGDNIGAEDNATEIGSSNALTKNNVFTEARLDSNSGRQNEISTCKKTFSEEGSSADSNLNNEASQEDFDVGLSGETSENNMVITKTSEKTCTEDSVNTHISENKDCDVDMEVDPYHSILDDEKRKENKLMDSKEVIVLDDIPSSSDARDPNGEIEPTLPVSVEISDVEVSVFRYEKNIKEKIKKTEEFKLDDMVLSSDDDSDGSENLKRESHSPTNSSKNILNITPDVPDDILVLEIPEESDTNCLEASSGLNETKHSQNYPGKKPEVEVMDVEDGSHVEENSNKNNEEETTKMDIEENDENLEETVMSSNPIISECLKNSSKNQDLCKSKDIEPASTPKIVDCKYDAGHSSNDSLVINQKDNIVDKNIDLDATNIDTKENGLKAPKADTDESNIEDNETELDELKTETNETFTEEKETDFEELKTDSNETKIENKETDPDELKVDSNETNSEGKEIDPDELNVDSNETTIENKETDPDELKMDSNETKIEDQETDLDELKMDSNETKIEDKETDPDEVKMDSNETKIEDKETDPDEVKMDSNETKIEDRETDLEDMLKAALSKNEKFRQNLSLESNEESNMKSSKSTVSKDADVICLEDDDDVVVNEKKKPAAAINCVNPNCMSGEDLAPPAMFVLSYFGLKRSKGQQVCAECFNMVVEHQEMLSSLLKERKPMLSAVFPSHKDVILLDSDEESLSDNESNLSDDTMSVIRENLDDVISESLAKIDFDFQLRESCNILNNRLAKLEEEASQITKSFDHVQHSLDEFRKQIYSEFHQETREKEEVHFMECEIPPMPIIKSKLQNQLYNRELMNRLRKSQQEKEVREVEEVPPAAPTRTIATKKVSQVSQVSQSQSQSQSPVESMTQDVTFVRSETKCEPPPNLPPVGPLVRPKLRVGDLAYTMKVSYFSIWVHCRIIEIIPRNPTENDPSTETYRVKLENAKKNSVRTVTGKYLAYPAPARVQLTVGVRVIAIFKEEDETMTTKDNYYVGVIAEPPKSMNKYRYLVFFDDGYTQYCPHENILVVCATSKNVWDDIHPEPRDFIKNYIQQYPERPMVKLSQGQIVKVEWNGRWWIVRVLEVDGSLVKVHFDADKRTEWIYRGSTRLGPMYQELAAAKERQTGSLLRSRGFGGGAHHKSDMPYVEYTRGDGDGDNETRPEDKEKPQEAEEQAPVPRSVARKSTAKKPTEPVISNTTYSKPLISHLPEGRLRQRKMRPKCRPLPFRPHQCSEACVSWTNHSPAAAKKYDPLVKPLVFGFERLMGSFKGKTIVQYRAPCGRMIRTQQEMQCYLRGTRSQLTIDLFDFDFWVNPLNEFEEGSTFGKIEDLSYGKENVRISCVNELDHSMPQYVQYMTARQPAKDVNLNLDPEFLVGCDCTDDCEDRSKCSCWQLTLQGKAYVPDGDLDPLFGYQYRRLPERIATGIYECNPRCKCSMTCQNRVAQQPLSCRLQLFKTLKKGWGIRCLHDIPRGAFICIYAGFLLTEQEANEGGKTYGDEYLAELDYIESVENLKEGYESEAKDPSDLEDDDLSQKGTMDIEYEHSADSDVEAEQGYTGRTGDIRSEHPPPPTLPPPPPPASLPWALRLRRRTADEAEKESRKSRADDDAISISDDEIDSVRKPKTFDANITVNEGEEGESKYPSVRELYGPEENVYIMDAKTHGNIGRYLNHSCSPNVFVQNVFVDTHDLRFPWVAFFANQYIPAGTELTWDYNYDVGSVPGKVMLCYCGSNHCRGRLL